MSPELFAILWRLAVWVLGTSGIVYGVIRYWGKKWIDSKFAEKFANYQHEQTKELMRLRVKIDSMLDGALKRQAKEFETLPIAWQKLDEAFGLLQWITSAMQNYPPVDTMNTDEFNEVLSNTKFLESQKEKLRKIDIKDRMDAFIEQDRWQRIERTQIAVAEFETFVANNGLFFSIEIKEQLRKIGRLMWAVISDSRMAITSKDGKYWIMASERLRDTVAPLYKAAESSIYTRFHSHSPAEE